MSSRTALWIAAGVVATLLVAAFGWSLLTTMKRSPDLEGSPAPALAIRSLQDGRTIRLADLRGGPVVLNFWASWCVACRQEASVLNAAARRDGGGVRFLGADFQDSEGPARKYQAEVGSPYPVGPIVEGSYRDFGVTAPPETFVIDARGVISARVKGPVSSTWLQLSIAEARAGVRA